MTNWESATATLAQSRLDDLSTAIQKIRYAQAYLMLAEPALKDMPQIWAEFQDIQQRLYRLVDPRTGDLL